MTVRYSEKTFHTSGRSTGRSWSGAVQRRDRERMNVTPSPQAACVRQRLSKVPFSAAGHWAISGNRSQLANPGRYAMPQWPAPRGWRTLPCLHDVSARSLDAALAPRAHAASTSCLPLKSETTPDHLSHTTSPTGHYFAIRVENEAAGWACGFFVSLLPPFQMTSKQSGKKNVPPVDKVRFGGATASIYANDVIDFPIPMYKVTVSRTYTVNGEYKTATSFRDEDLPYLIHVLQEAWVRIEQMKQQAWEAFRKDAPKEANESEAGEEQ